MSIVVVFVFRIIECSLHVMLVVTMCSGIKCRITGGHIIDEGVKIRSCNEDVGGLRLFVTLCCAVAFRLHLHTSHQKDIYRVTTYYLPYAQILTPCMEPRDDQARL